MKKSLLIFAACVCAVFSFPNITIAAEVIKNFRSDIFVQLDGSIDVKETIVVNAENKQIKHGIYRDIPTTYVTDHGFTYNTGFSLRSVLQDGKPQKYSTVNQLNGVRIYIGDKYDLVSTGEHRYEINYSMKRVLGYFDDHDELYWNVTGGDWAFPIEKASASVHLPESISPVDITMGSYTGFSGSKENSVFSSVTDGPTVDFETTRPLLMGEGLTIVTGWPKNIVANPPIPPMPKSFVQVAEDKMVVPPFIAQVVTAIILFAIYLGYFLYNWDRNGRDPKARVIVAEYEAPENMSPAVARFLMRKTYDDKVLGAQLIDMAARGLVDIQKVENRKEYQVEKLSTAGRKLSDEDEVLLKNLFGKSGVLTIDSHATEDTSDRIRLRRAEEVLTKHLERLIYDKLLFKNRAPFWTGVLIVTPLILLGTFIPVVFQEPSVGLIFLLTIPLLLSYAAWKSLVAFKFDTKSKKRGILEAIGYVLFRLVLIVVLAVIWAAGYFGTVFAILFFFVSISGLVNLALLGALIVTILVFAKLMPRYTEEGARLVEHLKGFKLFLTATEKDRLEFHHPPEKTPELFQKNLGYACAMGVEQKWGAQFGSAIFAATAEKRSNQRMHHMSYVTAASFASDFKGFSSVISAASTVPGSRSGSGGGGSSGGGGGGGGGGGW